VVDRPVDEKGQYKFELAPEFPFAIKRLRFGPTFRRVTDVAHLPGNLYPPYRRMPDSMGDSVVSLNHAIFWSWIT